MKAGIVGCSVVALAAAAFGTVKVAGPFADGMVLQRDKAIPVWGTGDAGEKVKVTFAGLNAETSVKADGTWRVDLPPVKMSREGRTLIVNEQKISDVLVGDVWFVCGQSNTEFPICGVNPHFSDRNGAAIASITHLPLVRICYQCDYKISDKPKTQVCRAAEWKKCMPETLMATPSFSAIGAYFAITVHQATGVPLGMVGMYWGGTGVMPWTPREGIATRPDLKDVLAFEPRNDWDGKNPASNGMFGTRKHDQPFVLWNEMVNPWCPFAMKGLLWYQGETDSRQPEIYCSKMHALYNGWSQKFECDGMKLYFVQLAPWGFTGIPQIQEAQADFEREEKNAGMAVINDVGNLSDIHPNEKFTVGLRLARMALKRDYGFVDIEDCSPVVKSHRVEGDKFILEFANAKRLYVYNRNYACDAPFELAGEDGVFHPAKIENARKEKRNNRIELRGIINDATKLVIVSDKVKQPKKLRYCHCKPWAGTVYNEANLPLGAFHIGE